MPVSPATSSSGVVRVTVLSDGEALPNTAQLITLSILRAVNRIPQAELVFEDVEVHDQSFLLTDSALLKPGVALTVKLGYGDDEDTVFAGIVTRIAVQVDQAHGRLTVECRDKAVAMTVDRRNANHLDTTDSDLMTTLIGQHGGLTADVSSTSVQWPQLVQHQATDWDMLLLRAQANGQVVLVHDATITVQPPATSAAPALVLTFGADIQRFQAELDARSQFANVTTASWDPANQALVTASATPAPGVTAGDLDSATLAQVLGIADYRLQTSALLDSAALSAWAQAQQTQADLARVRGRVSFQGHALALPGGMLQLKGVGARFSGQVFIGSVRHTVADGNWVTEVGFGLAPGGLAHPADVQAPPAAGLLPGVRGLQIGTVLKLDADPQGQQRIQVSLPVTAAATAGVWARLAQCHASNGFGSFLIPEVGDEVLLGFLNDDPANPVVLGSVYSSRHAPPYALSAENNTKALVTRCKAKIEIDDQAKRITVTTPGQNRLVLDDEAKSILLQDQHDNKLRMDSSGILIDSPKDITLNAKGGITLKAVGAVAISAQADVSVKGLNVAAEAQVGLSAKGTASAELSAAGQTTVKGALVMIN